MFLLFLFLETYLYESTFFNCLLPVGGVMYLVFNGQFFQVFFCEIECVCADFAICDLVHDMETKTANSI